MIVVVEPGVVRFRNDWQHRVGLGRDPLEHVGLAAATQQAHADQLFAGLQDPALYRFIAEAPPTDVEALRARYTRLATRRSPDGRQAWLNCADPHSLTRALHEASAVSRADDLLSFLQTRE